MQPRRQLLAGGERVALGRRALDIISVLAEARGGIVTKDELLEAVWPGVIVEENALQVHIVALRKALGPEAERLKTIRGVGYQLDVNGEAELHAMGPSGDPLEGDRPTPAPSPLSQASGGIAAWSSLRRFRPALIATAVLAVLLTVGLFVGPKLGIGGGERIPVVVRPRQPVGAAT